ncbi:MAG TPA: 30S ribosomal protein S12 methylthiotransferase RimO, partial [Actinomycetota bacterium]
PEDADVLMVNTCAFIGPAKEESIDAILDAARAKAAGGPRRLVVTGCLAQRYADALVDELPEVDAFVGTGDLERIAEAVEGETRAVYRGAQHVLPRHALAPRVRTGAWWTAYLKVSEGCDHDCSFCIIPKIRGRHESRPLGDVVSEAAALAAEGTVELNLVAQDLTAYGRDLRDGTSLAVLLEALAIRVPAIRWIRLLYAYPTSVTDELLRVMADERAVCRYLDMPLQHASEPVLARMRRPKGADAIRRLLARIREAVPGIALRSSFIVGFPGETDDDLRALLDFLDAAELDHVGVFRYSQEEDTVAGGLPDQVDPGLIDERWERVMAHQAAISARLAAARVGRTVEVLVEASDGDALVGRTSQQAPEIDGIITLRGAAAPGDLVRARVVRAGTYDLEGTIEAESPVDRCAETP